MGSVEIERHPAEAGIYPDQYEALKDDLQSGGYNVTFRDRPEQRDIGTALSIANTVINLARAAGLDDVRKAVLANLKGRLGGRRRIVEIRDANGNVLSEVEVPDD